MNTDKPPPKPQPLFCYCKGAVKSMSNPDTRLTPRQAAWMMENKPAYYTGNALQDIPHLPPELRFV